MNVVWKKVLAPADEQTINIPMGAEFLFVHEQANQICLWFRCDPSQPSENRTVAIRGTGHEDASGAYIGSAVLHGGSLVFHVFDRRVAS